MFYDEVLIYDVVFQTNINNRGILNRKKFCPWKKWFLAGVEENKWWFVWWLCIQGIVVHHSLTFLSNLTQQKMQVDVWINGPWQWIWWVARMFLSFLSCPVHQKVFCCYFQCLSQTSWVSSAKSAGVHTLHPGLASTYQLLNILSTRALPTQSFAGRAGNLILLST